MCSVEYPAHMCYRHKKQTNPFQVYEDTSS